MSEETKNTLNEEQHEPEQRVRNDWKAVLGKFSYRAIVDNVPFLAFVAVLCVVYINNSKKAVDTQRELNALNDTLKELKWEYMHAKSQMMSAQMEIEVMKNAAEIGLKPMLVPAFTIVRDENVTSNRDSN